MELIQGNTLLLHDKIIDYITTHVSIILNLGTLMSSSVRALIKFFPRNYINFDKKILLSMYEQILSLVMTEELYVVCYNFQALW